MKKENITKEIVTFTVDMELSYESPEGRQYLINFVKDDLTEDMGGRHPVDGYYSVKHVPGSQKHITPNT